jgi:hypothetical protein
MCTITTAIVGLAFLSLAACGGRTASPGATCGAGTMFVNGQCVAHAATGGSGGGSDTGSGGVMNAAGLGGDSMAGAGAVRVDAGSMPLVSSESGAEPICAGPPATCSTAPGLVEPFSTIDRVYAWVGGKWLFCTGQATWQTAPSDTIGVEFTPGSSTPTAGGSTAGGNMYYLVQGPSGPVRGAGFNYQLTYDVSPEGTGYQFNVHPAPNSGFWLRLKYSNCPRELSVMVFYSTTDSVLIAAN